jgi:membrane-associated phospholipid phosphatase
VVPLHERIDSFDARVDAWVERHRSPNLDRVLYGLSSAADHGMLWHAVGVAGAVVRRDPRYALRFSAALGAESALTNGGVKSLFRRVRPQENFAHDDPLPYGMRRPITSSFPSGHATTAFMCAGVLAKRPSTALPWFGLAALVAGSRVYVRMHHASDVLAGAALGLALAPAARRFVTRHGRGNRHGRRNRHGREGSDRDKR